VKSRWTAIVVCLLYAGISAVFAVHRHDQEALKSAPCVACAWHHHGQADLPGPADLVTPPDSAVFIESPLVLGSPCLFLQLYPSRGPPAIPQPVQS
jgi:hypothetical protein